MPSAQVDIKFKSSHTITSSASLTAIRASRVPPEPKQTEPGVVIHVQHPSLSDVKRKFHHSSKMTEVYDWVGSLAEEPKYFTLCGSSQGEALRPLDFVTVAEGIKLYVCQEDEPVMLSEDDNEVSFIGFGPVFASCDKTLIDDKTTPNDHDDPVNPVLCHDFISDVETALPLKIMADDSRCDCECVFCAFANCFLQIVDCMHTIIIYLNKRPSRIL